MQSNDVLDLHLTRLVGWLVQTLGKAFLVGAVVALIFGGLAALSGSVGFILIGTALGPIAAAVFLATADAPMPIEVDAD